MNYGLYLSASGVLTNLYRQDVFANNLANVQTAGFKPDMPDVRQREPEALEDRLGFDVSQRLLDRLGGGVFAGPQRIAFGQGSLQRTDQPLDVALTHEDHFFAVRQTDGESGEQSIRLTRNGQFSLNAAGELVTQAGRRVLNVEDAPIVIPPGAKPGIDPAGRILVDGEPVDQLQIARVSDKETLRKDGENLLSFEGPDPREVVEQPTVRPGMIEMSGADPIRTLMSLISASKSAMGQATMMRYHDLLMERAVNTLGSVA